MINSDKVMRAIAFYLCFVLFIVLLPILLSYALGYQVDYHALKIYKTGIVYLNSTPSGASIYINGKKHTDLTPAQIEELKPGVYKVEVRREGFYSWEREMTVRPNMVTRADRIILFPLSREIKKIGKHETIDFVVGKNYIYYFTRYGLCRSNIDGTGLKRLNSYSDWPKNIIQKKLSPDENKFIYFNKEDVYIAYLKPEKESEPGSIAAGIDKVMASAYPIIDVYWFSTGDYIIVVTEKDIRAIELRSGSNLNVVILYEFNYRPHAVYYDINNDSLYFTDVRKEPGNKDASRLYRIDLRQKLFAQFMELITKRETPTTK